MSVIDPSLLAPERMRPLKRQEYDRLAAAGCFEDEKIELLEGVLVTMSSEGPAHAYAVQQLTMLLTPALAARAIIRPRCPLAASDYSEPEPDLAVVPKANYRHEHPAGALLVIEVAESSLREDRLIKAGIYARAGIPEYWIVDIKARAVEVYRAPRDGAYPQITSHRSGEIVRPIAFDDVEVSVAEVVSS